METDPHQLYLLEQLDILTGVHMKPKFSDPVAKEFVKKLSAFTRAAVEEMFESAKVMLDLPRLGELIEMCRSIEKRLKGNETVKQIEAIPRTFDKESFTSALFSMMWLRYAKGWEEDDFNGTIFKHAFERQFPGVEYNFEKLKQTMPKDQVLNWMQAWEKRHGLKHL